MDCMWLRHLAQGKMHYLYSWIDFRLCKVCMTPCVHLSGYQSKSVSMKWRILPGWCNIHLFTLWSEDQFWSSSRIFCGGFITQMYLWFLRFCWCLIEAYIHLLDHSHAHKTLCLFSSQTKSGTGACGVQLRSPPFAQYKKVSRRFPKCLYFLFHHSQYLPFLLEPGAAAGSLTPTSCYSEICLS